MVIDKTSLSGTERGAVTGTGQTPQRAVWQEGHIDTSAVGGTLERKGEDAEVRKTVQTGWGGEGNDEQALGWAGDLGEYKR